MNTQLRRMLRSAAERCSQTYSGPTDTYENEQVVITETNVLTVTIAGSNDVWDWLQNATLDQVPLGDWRVSKGMVSAAKNVMRLVDKYRADEPKSYIKPLVFEGHSKGGAVAVVCAMLSVLRHNRVSQVITFGAPRFTTQQIEYPFPVYRVEAQGDPVPKVPVWKPWVRWTSNGEEILIGNPSRTDSCRRYFGFLWGSVRRHLIHHYNKLLR